ncbi:RcnB family protein [Sphingosinicella sp. YJ22]|uniref:RcnB family protein n=1 Tax=Sphingosinicella sp. YJ22 TaxID=1104780 RepID=UPI00140CF392|nr:RcnB family protein [Sphingosinicella sp. YJ22]
MKRAVTLVLLAATTALTVPAAVAQDSNANEARSERRETRQATRADRREARQQRRSDSPRAQAPAETAQAPAETQVAPARTPPAPAAVVAQRRDRDGNRSDRGNRPRVPQSQTVRDAWQGNPNDPARARYERQAAENALRYGTREQRREVRQDIRQDRREDRRDRREDRAERREDRRDWRQDRRADRREWRRDWRNDRRYDWGRYRNQNRFVFRLNPYYSPYGYGYGYRRFGIGSVLDSLLFGRNYWVSDPWQYRLPPAPPGYQWVRYYNDVILVDTWNGRVVDVIYDFFW